MQPAPRADPGPRVSDLVEQWLAENQPRTLGDLVEAFGEKSFAIVFIVLLGVPALPLPTGGVTHVFEAIAMLVALQLVIGRNSIWLPDRWNRVDLRGRTGERLTGALVFVFSLTAFLAPPFSGLDTLPALGVVVMSLGVLFADFLLVAAGTLIGSAGIVAVVGLGGVIVRALRDLV
jgi:hypothetical protein